MKIKTGEGYISLITLIAIWSVSLVTTLPGLAVSPILGRLDKIFPTASQLEIQMLSCIPYLMIIPFILISGKLSDKINKILLLAIGLAIFLGSGILCFFAKSMIALILLGGVLGIGAGIVIPLSTGLITDFFVGRYRTQQMGVSSALTTFAMIVATLLTGYLAGIEWHLAFVVYLIPILPLILTVFLKQKKILKNTQVNITAVNQPEPAINPLTKNSHIPKSINIKQLISVFCFYFFISFTIVIILYDVPFIMQRHNMSSTLSGAVISSMFVGLMRSGVFLNKLISVLKSFTIPVALLFQSVGLLGISCASNLYVFFASAVIGGLGYGVLQPMMYDKAAMTATGNHVFMALA